MRRFVLAFVLVMVGSLLPTQSLAQAEVPAAEAVSGETASGQGFVGVTPSRLLDTRNGTGAARGAVGDKGTLNLQVAGRGGVPASGVAAVVVNVTVTGPTAAGFITVWPTGSTRPLASNLNFVPGQTVPNLVVVKLGTNGMVSLFNSSGTTHLVADVSGYYTTGSQLQPVTPVRLLDTRNGTGGINGPTSGTVDVQVAGRAGIPLNEATAVILNVTVTSPRSSGYLTVWPKGAARPNASNLNFTAGVTVPNLVIAKVGAQGQISYYSSATTHVVMDVLGYVRTPVMLTEALDEVDDSSAAFGFVERSVPVQGKERFNSLTLSSVSTTPHWTEYNLGRHWGTLATTLTYSDDKSAADSLARFRILGDGAVLVDRQVRFGEAVDVTADVQGVLRIRFEVTGIPRGTALTFADPRLMVAAGAAFPTPQDYMALLPARILDTRDGTGAAKAAVQPGSSTTLQVLGNGGVPRDRVDSVVLNVTVTQPRGAGYVTVWPTGIARPLASNLNFTPGLTVPNLVIVPVGRDGKVDIYNGSSDTTHIVADVLGYFPRAADSPGTTGRTVLMTEALDEVDDSSAAFGVTEGRAMVQGQVRFNSLVLSSTRSTPSWAEYNLGRQWRSLTTRLAFDDDRSDAASVVRFRILGDGVPLLDRTLAFGQYADVTVDVTGVLRLRFEFTAAPRGIYPVVADPSLGS